MFMFYKLLIFPCSAIQLWVARTLDDKVCAIESIESDCLSTDLHLLSSTTLLFGGHMSGYITLLKGDCKQLFITFLLLDLYFC